jgi:L,D-transpeptidase catalytic domain
MKIIPLVLAALAALAGCGAPDSDRAERALESDVLAAPGPATHEICGDDINVRNASLSVIGKASRGEKVTLMPERVAGTAGLAGNTFARVYFHAAPAGYGYVGQQFVCKLGSQPPAPAGKRLIEVNYTTNRLKFFVDGKLVREWNVGTMRQAVLDANDYKVGRYTIWAKDVCPPWTKPGTSNTIAGCAADNPLGTRGLWFSGYLYGLHGTTEAWKIADGTTADQRRVSSGCIRNANANIEWLYDQVKIGDEVNLHW